MWWEKKFRRIVPSDSLRVPAAAATPEPEKLMTETMPRDSDLTAANQNQTILGRSVVFRGELSGKEDLLIEGQFEGTINLQEHCLTIGPHGQLKAEIHARQVIVQGSVNGNIAAREKIEIRKSAHVVGDVVAGGIAIEDGAYFKGSVDILREQPPESALPVSTPNALKATA